MSSATSTELIMFIAASVAAAGAASAFAVTAGDLSHEMKLRGFAHADALATDVLIVNDPGHVPTSPLIVYVKNVGRTVLNEMMTTITVDGQYVTPDDVRLEAGAETWGPGDVARYRIPESEATLDAGDHAIRVVTENGEWDDFRFRVGT